MTKEIEDIEQSIHTIANELCKTISGQFDITLQLSNPHESIQKLIMILNFLLESMRKKVEALNDSAIEKDSLIEKLEQSIHIDSLTGLYNRNYFHPFLKQQCVHAERYNECFAIALCDIDNFKSINERYNYLIGDAIIKEASLRLQNSLRDVDTLARLNGNEFGILMPQLTKPEEAGVIAYRLQKTFEQPFIIDNFSIQCHCSIGISTFPHSSSDLKGLLKNADLALHDAKKSDENKYVFFSKEIEFLHKKQEHIYALLRASFENTFTIFFQPTYNLKNETQILSGCELLLRFKERLPYNINTFDVITIAEQRGLMPTFGLTLLTFSFSEISKIYQQYPYLHFGINLSVTQFDSHTLVEQIIQLTRKYALPPSNIVFEVTESALVEDEGVMFDVLKELQENQFKIAIDDFGKGYSSLTRLKNIPADILKIDMDFTQALAEDQQTQKIVKTIIDLSHSLGLKVICEGIETQKQLQLLTSYQCDAIQGYLLSKPLEHFAFRQLLEQSKL